MTDSRRVLLKVSGEWFSGAKEKGFDEKTFASLTESLIEAKNQKNSNCFSSRGRKYL
jgi:uridylate kinase